MTSKQTSADKPNLGGAKYVGPSRDAIIEALGRHRYSHEAAAEMGLTPKSMQHYCAVNNIIALEHRLGAKASKTRPPGAKQLEAIKQAAAVMNYWQAKGYKVTAREKFDPACAEWRVVSDLVNGMPQGYLETVLHSGR